MLIISYAKLSIPIYTPFAQIISYAYAFINSKGLDVLPQIARRVNILYPVTIIDPLLRGGSGIVTIATTAIIVT